MNFSAVYMYVPFTVVSYIKKACIIMEYKVLLMLSQGQCVAFRINRVKYICFYPIRHRNYRNYKVSQGML